MEDNTRPQKQHSKRNSPWLVIFCQSCWYSGWCEVLA